jgi:hypothetical protein
VVGEIVGTDTHADDPTGAQSPDPDQRSREGEQPRTGSAVHDATDRGTQDNVARAWAMLREAAELGERAITELTHGRGDAAAQQRTLLAALRADVVQLQEHVERLAQRVADVIDVVESKGPTEGGPVPTSMPPTPARPAASGANPEEAAGGVPALASPFRARAATGPAVNRSRSQPTPMTMVMHGVPSAATAMSLQRYLTELGQVVAVEPEQFAAGQLRLRVTTTGPIDLDDLRGWPGGDGLALVTARADQIDVRLSGPRDM